MLKKHGVKKGDRVAVYLPMIGELPVVLLACARLGAIHMVVFGGFSAEALKARIDNCGAKVLICADKGHRGAKNTPSKTNADIAVTGETTVETVIVVKRVDGDVPMTEGRDVWYHDEMAAADITADCPPVPVDAEHPLFILYTSGSTGTPKGVLHSTGGYLLYVHDTAKYVFDLHDDDIHFCTADIGWITGHSYIVYGPLAVRRHQHPLRGSAHLPAARPLLAGRREARGHHHLHGPDRHPQPHRPGRRVARQARHAEPARHGLGRRADRRQQLAVVLREDRQGPHPAVRHLVADRDRRPHDHAAAGRLHPQARLGRQAVLRRADRRSSRTTAAPPASARTGISSSPPPGPA